MYTFSFCNGDQGFHYLHYLFLFWEWLIYKPCVVYSFSWLLWCSSQLKLPIYSQRQKQWCSCSKWHILFAKGSNCAKTTTILPSNNTTCKQVYELFQSTITQWTTKDKIQHSVRISAPSCKELDPESEMLWCKFYWFHWLFFQTVAEKSNTVNITFLQLHSKRFPEQLT